MSEELNIEYKKTEELIPYVNNPKEHPEEQIDKIASSIKEFGFKNPIIIDKDNTIIAGHGRHKACKKLGIEKVPCIKAKDLTKAQVKAYRLADNRIAESSWDDELLSVELEDLEELDIDKELTGFEEDEIRDLENKEHNIGEDEVPEYDNEEAPETNKGDIYKLGEHRLMCGDAADKNNVNKLLKGKEIKTIFTSPPYNMAGEMYEDYSDDMKSEKFIKFNLKTAELWKKYLNGYIFWNISYNKNSRWEFLEIMNKMVKELNLRFLEMIIWNKKSATPIQSKDMLTRQHEPILLLGEDKQIKEDIDVLWFGTVKKKANLYKDDYTGYTNYWEKQPNNIQFENLKACFPVEIPSKGILMTTNKKDIVADPFSGSGSTLIACEQTDRIFYGMELNEKYCDLIVERWEEYTGKQAEKIKNVSGESGE